MIATSGVVMANIHLEQERRFYRNPDKVMNKSDGEMKVETFGPLCNYNESSDCVCREDRPVSSSIISLHQSRHPPPTVTSHYILTL